MKPKIKEAIKKYNSERKVSEPKLTIKSLALKIGVDPWYMSRWNNGHNLGKLTPEIVSAICKQTGTDPNFLYGHIV